MPVIRSNQLPSRALERAERDAGREADDAVPINSSVRGTASASTAATTGRR